LSRKLHVFALAAGAVFAGAVANAEAQDSLAVGDQIRKTAGAIRNFDWTRPTPNEIVANPNVPPGSRPHINDVGPWSVDEQGKLLAPAQYLKSPEKIDEATRAWFARWARPKPEEITPNPRAPWGARPYLRSVGPGYAENQGDVRDYSGARYSGPKNATRNIVAGGATSSGPKGSPPLTAKSTEQASSGPGPTTETKVGAQTDTRPAGAVPSGDPTNTGPAGALPSGNPTNTAQEPGRSAATTTESNRSETPGGAAASDRKAEGENSTAPLSNGAPRGNNGTSANSPSNPAKKAGDSATTAGEAPTGGAGGSSFATGPPDGPAGAGGSIADISAAIRQYLASAAQSGTVDVTKDLAGSLVMLLQAHPPAALSSLKRAEAQAPRNDNPSSTSNPDMRPWAQQTPIAVPTRDTIKVVPGRIEFSGVNPSVRGDIR
jgi:hypothetical protein